MSQSDELIFTHVVSPKDAVAWTMEAGDQLRITDLEGKQVGDLVLFDLYNRRDKLSISWTRTRNIRDITRYVPPLGLYVGDRVWSTGYRVLATVTEDTATPVGIHDLNGRMCNRGMYELYGEQPQDGCHELLSRVLRPHGIAPEDIPDAIGVFMHTRPDPETRVMTMQEPVSKAGDRFGLTAEVALLAAMSTCPMDVIAPTNGWHITPMRVEVLRSRTGPEYTTTTEVK
ncbi:MAG: urea carboxylase-associated family protein [Actinomycetota bacterium]|nr:urea carboxylase-associated family protein [Actinomycetota bacterium]